MFTSPSLVNEIPLRSRVDERRTGNRETGPSTEGKVVRVFGGEERTVALASTPLSTDELWFLTDTKRQSGQPHHNKDRDDV